MTRMTRVAYSAWRTLIAEFVQKVRSMHCGIFSTPKAPYNKQLSNHNKINTALQLSAAQRLRLSGMGAQRETSRGQELLIQSITYHPFLSPGCYTLELPHG